MLSNLCNCHFYSFAVLLIEKKDEEGQSQVLSAALEVESFGSFQQPYVSSCFCVHE